MRVLFHCTKMVRVSLFYSPFYETEHAIRCAFEGSPEAPRERGGVLQNWSEPIAVEAAASRWVSFTLLYEDIPLINNMQRMDRAVSLIKLPELS